MSELNLDKVIDRSLRKIRRVPSLRRRGPQSSNWQVDATFITAPAMTRLNGRLRGKSYATDILSFEAPGPVRETGWLGELVICRPTLMRQAREHGHSPATELEILVIHGLLHLLGFDHEGQGPKAQRAAREMARHEGALLGRASKGLIGRTQPSVRS